ncbi:MAG TPA: hypothetical protein VK158_02585 [Acidobacteriota bacterium]|nr:hypothetical protein [Acidobacteriota bacterium]
MKKRGMLLASLLSMVSVSAAESSGAAVDWVDPVTYISLALFIVAFVLTIVIVKKHPIKEKNKKYVFMLIAVPIMLSTLYMAGHTVYENVHSLTKGPIHWHADYQVWVCGERLDLVNPKFPSNKIGSPLFHEHNDDRIHVEGTVNSYEDIDFESFFSVIGGKLTNTELRYITNTEVVEKTNGDACNGVPSQLAIYVNGARIADVTKYMYAHETLVPPGDCVIVEFGPNMGQTTDRICESWDVMGWTYENADEKRGEN